MYLIKKEKPQYAYRDVFLVPKYSDVLSRKEVDTSVELPRGFGKVDVPVISANMDSVTDGYFAHHIREAGGIGAIHRFMTIEQNIEEFKKSQTHSEGNSCFVSIGVNKEDYEPRTKALYDAGARMFVVDIAHGHSLMMQNTLTWLRDTYGYKILIMAGNVATPEGVMDLVRWGADMIKVGIAPGKVCLTKNVTGVTFPQFSAVLQCAAAASVQSMSPNIQIVADGGIQEIGDIAKALGAGADFAMCGSMFAGCKESASLEGPDGKKIYRGMASRGAMKVIRPNDPSEQLPTPEGKQIFVQEAGSVYEVVRHIKGGLQSSFSYLGARSVEEFQTNAEFGVRQHPAPY